MAFRNNGKLISTTAFEDFYTCPAGKEAVVHALYIANTHATDDILVDVRVNIASDTIGTFFIIQAAKIIKGTSLVFDKPINLREGDIIQIKPNIATSCEAFASILLEDASI